MTTYSEVSYFCGIVLKLIHENNGQNVRLMHIISKVSYLPGLSVFMVFTYLKFKVFFLLDNLSSVKFYIIT